MGDHRREVVFNEKLIMLQCRSFLCATWLWRPPSWSDSRYYQYRGQWPGDFCLSIQHRKPAPAHVVNPFACYPDFSAQLWSSEFEDKIMYIPAMQSICHSKSRIWVTGVVVIKAIKSEGFQICQFFQDLQYPSGNLNSTSSYFLVILSYYVAYFISCDWYIFSLDVYIQESTQIW